MQCDVDITKLTTWFNVSAGECINAVVSVVYTVLWTGNVWLIAHKIVIGNYALVDHHWLGCASHHWDN